MKGLAMTALRDAILMALDEIGDDAKVLPLILHLRDREYLQIVQCAMNCPYQLLTALCDAGGVVADPSDLSAANDGN